MAIIDHIEVNITVTTVTPSRPAFGVLLIAGYLGASPPFTGLVRDYTSLAAAVSDGIVNAGPTQAAYLSLEAAFSQSPRGPLVRFGRLTTAPAPTYTLECLSAVQGDVYRLNLEGTEITYTVPGAATTTTVATALELLIDAVTGVSSTSSAAVITITPDTAGKRLRFRNWSSNLKFTETTADPSIASNLDAIANTNSNFYGLSIVGQGRLETQAAAAWAETRPVLFFPTSSDSAVYDGASTTDTAAALRASNLDRTTLMFNGNDNQRNSGAAWFMDRSTYRPGSATYKFSRLRNVVADDQLTQTQVSAIKAKRANTFLTDAGLAFTQEGTLAGNTNAQWIDVRFGLDYLESEIKARVIAALVGNPKLPYTNAGQEVLMSLVRGVLLEAEDPSWALLAPNSSIVTGQDIDLLDPSIRGTRVMSTISFTTRLGGAIHKAVVTGSVSF